jgi:hypothetical protein
MNDLIRKNLASTVLHLSWGERKWAHARLRFASDFAGEVFAVRIFLIEAADRAPQERGS